MEPKDKRGGKRTGAGRKALPVMEKKVTLTIYPSNKDLVKFGGKRPMVEEIAKFIAMYGKDAEIKPQPSPVVFDSPELKITHDEPSKFLSPQIALKSFEQWQREKRECETEEKWEEIKAGIKAATNLTSKQKELLIKYS